MTTGAMIFWIMSWTFVLGLAGWSFYKVIQAQDKRSGK